MRLLILAVIAGCAHVPVTAQPAVLAAHADELSRSGYARIEVEQGGTQRVAADDLVSVVLPGNQHRYLWGLVTTGKPDETRDLTIRNLVAGCPDCLATHAVGQVSLGTRREVDPTMLTIGAFGAAATVGSVACLIACSDVGGWAYVGATLAIATLALPLATAF